MDEDKKVSEGQEKYIKDEKKISNDVKPGDKKRIIGESNFLKKLRSNPWIIAAIVLTILVLALVFNNFFMTGKVVSADEIGNNLLNFYQSNGVTGLTLDSVTEVSGVYQINFLYQGNIVPIYSTKDGKLIGSLSVLPEANSSDNSGATQTQDIPKSDKPLVELFVMSYCPYGTQAEKGIIPAIQALGDSVDFKLRFVYYAMHPTYGEVEENLRQYCIQEEQSDKFLDYLTCFLDAGDSESCLSSAGIDQNKLDTCTQRVDQKYNVIANLNDKSSWLSGSYPLFNIDKDLNEKYGVQGSPTLVINGQVVENARDPESYLTVICSAFSEGTAPVACSTQLSTTAYSSGFGWDGSAPSSSASATCG